MDCYDPLMSVCDFQILEVNWCFVTAVYSGVVVAWTHVGLECAQIETQEFF